LEGLGIVLGVLAFMLLIFLGLPIFFCFFAGTMVVVLLLDISIDFIPGVAFFAANSPVLVAVALFVFGGYIMSHGGIADPLMRLAYTLVRKLRGGLAAVCVVTALMFAALTGSGLASIAATGAIMIPRMERYGYDRRYSTAVICASGFLGYLIPPSIPVLLYCFIAQQSIAALFMATVIPGIMLAIGYLIVTSGPTNRRGNWQGGNQIFQRSGAENLRCFPRPALPTDCPGRDLWGNIHPNRSCCRGGCL